MTDERQQARLHRSLDRSRPLLIENRLENRDNHETYIIGTVKVEDFSVDFDVDSSPNCDVIFEVKNRGKGIIMESFA